MCLSDLAAIALSATIGATAAAITGINHCVTIADTETLRAAFNTTANNLGTVAWEVFTNPNFSQEAHTYLETDLDQRFTRCMTRTLVIGGAVGVAIAGTSRCALRCFKNICLGAAVGVAAFGLTVLVPQYINNEY